MKILVDVEGLPIDYLSSVSTMICRLLVSVLAPGVLTVECNMTVYGLTNAEESDHSQRRDLESELLGLVEFKSPIND